MAFVKERISIKFCVRLGKSATVAYKMLKHVYGSGNYHKLKLLSGINVSEKAGKVPKMTDALGICRLPAPLKSSKRFLRRYIRTGSKQ